MLTPVPPRHGYMGEEISGILDTRVNSKPRSDFNVLFDFDNIDVNINKHSIKNLPKMEANNGILRLLEESWKSLGRSGRIFGESSMLLGAQNRLLRDFGGLLRRLESKKVANMPST